MKALLLVVVAGTVVTALELGTNLASSWDEYKNKFGKKYANVGEEKLRYAIWLKNHAIINAHNAKTDTLFTMEENELADKTKAEIQKRLGTIVPPEVVPLVSTQTDPLPTLSTLPTAVDWRTSVCMPAVKDQGQCGSCWAFAATNPLEFATCKKAATEQAIVLSESQLVNGSYPQGNRGCKGGYYTRAWDYIKVAPGQASASSLPYYPADGRKCLYTANMKAATLSSYVQLRAGDVTQIMESVANQGPVATAMAVLTNSFTYYKSGIYADPNCLDTAISINHAVVIVGYGNANGTAYWIVRNSWGASWGADGYFLIKRGVNMCKIESLVYYVVP